MMPWFAMMVSLCRLKVEGKVRKARTVSSKKKKRVDSRVSSLAQYKKEDVENEGERAIMNENGRMSD